MTRSAFQFICEQLRSRLRRNNTSMRDCVPVDKRVAMCIWHLATQEDHRSLSWRFSIGKSTVCTIINEVCEAIVQVLLSSYIRWPTDQRLLEIIHGFEERWKFPQCIGTIDGIHNPIIAPSECSADYYNRKGFYSVIMQAAVDHDYRYFFT